jgi:hypothetical protein
MLKKILFSLAGLLSTLLILHLVAPNELKIEKEIVINQPKTFVFGYLKFFRNTMTWNPFLEKDPKAIVKLNGTDGTVGSSMYWSGNMDLGTGEQEIKTIVENEKIDFEVRFIIPFQSTIHSYLITESIDQNQTRVKWGMSGKMPFPMNIINMFKGGMNEAMQKDFAHGLERLKSQMEKLIAVPEFKL